ncbi:hypothetical protein CJ255_13565 [Candidatus Viridilinea mediisalina]|uniref:Uncharacterized protein n=2 Tax=Candidatus Viridilinea mediisalina TaxID=2024553 RepID=A0A2A6RHZ4_9CHLR|nr:hypothetical protein CJ255_13565 [Candidatus Viridilinea mediisalina]
MALQLDRITPTSIGENYVFKVDHRDGTGEKSQWIISLELELAVFEFGYRCDWLSSGKSSLWSLYVVEKKPYILGVSPLYLWDIDNVVYVYDWEKLIKSIVDTPYLTLPFTCAFSRGDLLYQPTDVSQLLFGDEDIKQVIEAKFHAASQRELVFSRPYLTHYLMGEQESPFAIIHDDSAIYNDQIFAITESGLFSAETHKPKKNKKKINHKADKLWEGIGTSIQVGARAIAIAAGNDGLFEYQFRHEHQPKQLSSRHTLFANWAFTSIYGSSDMEPSYLAAFYWQRDDQFEDIEGVRPKYTRQFSGIMEEARIFGQQKFEIGLSWGRQEKMYRVSSTGLEAVRFKQGNLTSDDKTAFEVLGLFDLGFSNGTEQVVSGGISYFGVIIETGDGLHVIESSGNTHFIQGPMTRWRVFPRSVQYENYLHVILEDRIDIYSFNNDYFVNQREKAIGIEYKINLPVSKK